MPIKHVHRSMTCPAHIVRNEGKKKLLTLSANCPISEYSWLKMYEQLREGEPAAGSYDEIIFCYPGLLAVTVYRIAHQLHLQKIPLMPRIMSEYSHGLTGIDIHPGAHIGESFFIDYRVGVVIGETANIGNHVRIYDGVTLGALSLSKAAVERLRGKKRHTTIEDGVIIYAGATILGGETVVGAGSIIGGTQDSAITLSVRNDAVCRLYKPIYLIYYCCRNQRDIGLVYHEMIWGIPV